MGLQTSVSAAKSGTPSLKTTVPQGIAAFLELTPADKLEWKFEVDEKGERWAKVRKAKQ